MNNVNYKGYLIEFFNYDGRPTVRLLKLIDDTVEIIKGDYGLTLTYNQTVVEYQIYIDDLTDTDEVDYSKLQLPLR